MQLDIERREAETARSMSADSYGSPPRPSPRSGARSVARSDTRPTTRVLHRTDVKRHCPCRQLETPARYRGSSSIHARAEDSNRPSATSTCEAWGERASRLCSRRTRSERCWLAEARAERAATVRSRGGA
jgi:hypothetical protein